MLTLNPTASTIWQRLSQGRTATQIAAQLAADFSISQEQAFADVNEFLEQLRAQQLIEPEESSGSRTLAGSKPAGLFCNLFGTHKSGAAQERGSK
jgi:hypothetical protein